MNLALIAQASAAAVDSVSKAKISENSSRFTEIDPFGIGMTFIGMSVVFLSLILLYLLFMNISKLIIKRTTTAQTKTESETEQKKPSLNLKSEDEVSAAIALALHLYATQLHDHENTVLTINRVARTYSPWSSKIYGLRQFPR